MREVCWIVKNGVPWDVAMEMSPERRFGLCVIFSELEGAEFDLSAMQFVEPKK